MKLIHLLVYNKASFAQDIKPEEELRGVAPPNPWLGLFFFL
jgi:hypothetical protein